MEQLAEFVTNHWILVTLFIVVSVALLTNIARSAGGVTPNQAVTMINKNNAVVIDVRPEKDFKKGLMGIKLLPIEAKFGVFMAYRYYNQLLKKLKQTPAPEIKNTRVRVANLKKVELLTRSYVKYQLNLM